MSKTQSDTEKEEGLYVNKKVEKKRGRQDTQADRWGQAETWAQAHVCTHAQHNRCLIPHRAPETISVRFAG